MSLATANASTQTQQLEQQRNDLYAKLKKSSKGSFACSVSPSKSNDGDILKPMAVIGTSEGDILITPLQAKKQEYVRNN